MVAALEDDDPGVQWISAEALALLGRDGIIPLLKALRTRSDSPGLRRGAHHVLRLCTDENLKKETAPVLTALEGIEQELEVPIAAERALAALQGREPL
jgi:HEAT repeat protein